MIKTLEINFTPPYPIYMGSKVLATAFVAYCKNLTQRLVIVTDSYLVNSWGKKVEQLLREEKISVELISIPAGEANKTRETKHKLEDTLFEKNYGRDTCLIALGGGVVTDLTGFVGATYCRGIPVIYVPTTLLAMVDASIGGKTGVDTPYGKNLVGAFHQPKAVFMDLAVLESLPLHEWRNGIVEMLKHGLIDDAAIFKVLEENAKKIKDPEFLLTMIYASCAIKKKIIEQDEREGGVRQLVNYGHTIGHAIESLENYQISHGEAVAIGMIVEAYLSVLCGFMKATCVGEIERALRTYGLPLKTSAFADLPRLNASLGLDKKALKNVPHFVLLDAVGKAHQDGKKYAFAVEPALLEKALQWAHKKFS